MIPPSFNALSYFVFVDQVYICLASGSGYMRSSSALFIFTLRENISFISSNVLRRHLPPLDKLTDNFDAPNKKMERLHVSIVQHAMGIQNRQDNSNQQ